MTRVASLWTHAYTVVFAYSVQKVAVTVLTSPCLRVGHRGSGCLQAANNRKASFHAFFPTALFLLWGWENNAVLISSRKCRRWSMNLRRPQSVVYYFSRLKSPVRQIQQNVISVFWCPSRYHMLVFLPHVTLSRSEICAAAVTRRHTWPPPCTCSSAKPVIYFQSRHDPFKCHTVDLLT